jgi:hypothetical protein
MDPLYNIEDVSGTSLRNVMFIFIFLESRVMEEVQNASNLSSVCKAVT